MSGIVGYIGKHIKDDKFDLIASMSQAIKYVENDLTDQWRDEHLGIARVHHGIVNHERQPILNEDRSLLIFMDGEVFDYDEDKNYLLSKGHLFRYEKNDAEFCLHLYEELGEESFVKLNGSFLIVIYNLHTKELILINDRFSSCPLFYCAISGQLIFGAQLKAVIQSHQVPRNLDSRAILEFFTFQRLLGDKTYYKDIKLLYPASILRYQEGKISQKRYWEMSYQENKPESKEYYINAMAEAIKTAVKRRTNDKYHYGMLLSGGLDSRAVIAASGFPMPTFTIADFENKEVKIAKRIADYIGCPHLLFNRDHDYYPNLVEKAVELGDGMFSFHHAHFLGMLNNIRKECDVLLHGYAFDTLYKGSYLPAWKIKILNKTIDLPIMRKLSDKTLLESILHLSTSLWSERPDLLFSQDIRIDFSNKIKNLVKSNFNEYDINAKNYNNKFNGFLINFPFRHLTYLNQICMKNLMAERIVAFDNDLFNLCLEIPAEMRFNAIVFRKALEKIDPGITKIHDANTGLLPTVSRPLEWVGVVGEKLVRKVSSPKLQRSYFTQGSWPDFAELVKNNKKMQQLIWGVINDQDSINPDIFDQKRIVKMFKEFLDNKRKFSWFFFLILTFGVWYKKYGPR